MASLYEFEKGLSEWSRKTYNRGILWTAINILRFAQRWRLILNRMCIGIVRGRQQFEIIRFVICRICDSAPKWTHLVTKSPSRSGVMASRAAAVFVCHLYSTFSLFKLWVWYNLPVDLRRNVFQHSYTCSNRPCDVHFESIFSVAVFPWSLLHWDSRSREWVLLLLPPKCSALYVLYNAYGWLVVRTALEVCSHFGPVVRHREPSIGYSPLCSKARFVDRVLTSSLCARHD
jgi:hypothetical protein